MKTILINVLLVFQFISFAVGQTNFFDQLSDSTILLTKQNIIYNPSYFNIKYRHFSLSSLQLSEAISRTPIKNKKDCE